MDKDTAKTKTELTFKFGIHSSAEAFLRQIIEDLNDGKAVTIHREDHGFVADYVLPPTEDNHEPFPLRAVAHHSNHEEKYADQTAVFNAVSTFVEAGNRRHAELKERERQYQEEKRRRDTGENK